jgi:surface antigen
LVWRKPKHSFYWWNCTWYVAQYKNVNWWGDANEWLRNARSKGHATGNSPKLWAIVSFEWRGYNPVYGHVWIVVWIKWWDIIVSDMNYRKLWEVTYRRVSQDNRAIEGYIYVD